jgi:hypothetical protein
MFYVKNGTFRSRVSFCAVAMLLGCGGSAAPYVTPNGAEAANAAIGKATPVLGALKETLLYATAALHSPNKLYVFSYPDAKSVAAVTVPNRPEGLCTDGAGDIYVTTTITNSGKSYVYEYAHGGTRPIATLTDPGGGNGCAIDPLTGDLAVANWYSGSGSSDGNVAIYRNARGTPRTFTAGDISAYWWCAYDDEGDLFVDGINGKHVLPLVELSKGASSFENIALNKSIAPSSLQWLNGELLVAADGSGSGPERLYRVKVSANKGTVVGSTVLRSRHGRNSFGGQFVVSGTDVVGPSYPRRFLSVWSYPQGGPALRYVRKGRAAEFYGVAISASH